MSSKPSSFSSSLRQPPEQSQNEVGLKGAASLSQGVSLNINKIQELEEWKTVLKRQHKAHSHARLPQAGSTLFGGPIF